MPHYTEAGCGELADRQWPGEGYKAKGLRTCNALWDHCINKHTGAPLLGDWVGDANERCGPMPDICYYDITRPSDFCLSHFLAFSQVTALLPMPNLSSPVLLSWEE